MDSEQHGGPSLRLPPPPSAGPDISSPTQMDDPRERAIALGAALRDARLRAGLSQEEVAESVELDPMMYGGIERGRLVPTIPILTRLCVLLKLDPDELPELPELKG